MVSKQQQAGLAWLIDLAGAALFAWGLADAIGQLAAGGGTPVRALLAMVAGGAVRALAVWLVHRLAIAGAQATVAGLRRQLFAHLLGGRLAEPPSIGRSATLAIDHLAVLESYEARFVPSRLAASLAPLVVIGIVAFASLVAAAILFATIIPFVAGMILAGSLARRASERQLAALGLLSGLFVDRLRALPIIRHFRAEERITRQVRAATAEVADRTVLVLRAAFVSSAVLEFFSALAVALVAVYCGFSLLGLLPFPAPETLSLQAAFFALAMAPEFYLPMRRLAAAYHDKQLGEAARAEIDALGAEAPNPGTPDPGPPTPMAPAFAGLAADALEIAWPGCRIGPATFVLGRTGLIAVTGPTGSGKTSLLAAIAGQVAPFSGTVTVIDPDALAWAAQRPLILPGSLRDNLALARPESDDRSIIAAAEQVGLGPLLAARAGLDLMLDHRGSGLSGGERRRLGLARAILADRPLLLCDEPTADLDAASATAIVALLGILAQRHAVVVATHDPVLIAAADQRVTL